MTGYELEILEAIHKLQCPFLDFIIPKISFLGNAGMIWIIFAAVLLCFKKTRRCGFAVGAALIISLILDNIILKNVVARERPFTVDPSIELLIPKPTDYSFPSGHTLSSFASATAMMYYERRPYGRIALAFAFVIAFTRLYLRVHFPSDVLGGAVIGVGFGFLAIIVTQYAFKKISARRTIKEN